MAHAPRRMLGSQQGCSGGSISQQVFTSLFYLKKSSQLLFRRALTVNLSKEHCTCAFLFGSLSVVGAYHHRGISFCVIVVVVVVYVQLEEDHVACSCAELHRVSEDVFMHSSPGPCAVEASCKVVPSDSLLSK